MRETLTFIRINPPSFRVEYSEFNVNAKDLYSLLHFLHRTDEPDEMAAYKKHLREDDQLTEEQIQDLLDGALMWIAMDHPAELMPYKEREITLLTQKILSLGATAQTIVKGGTTLLMKTIRYPERLEMLLSLPETKRPDLDRVNIDGDTALILAVYNNYRHSVHQLLQAGANPAIRNHFGKKAAMYSADFAMIDKLESTEKGLQLQKTAVSQKSSNQDDFQGAFFQPPERRCNIM